MKGKTNPTIGTRGRLEKLLAFHRRAVESIELTMGLMNGQSQASATARAAQTIAAAITHDTARRATTKTKTGKRRGRPPKVRATADDAPVRVYGKAKRKQRARTAKFLNLFSQDKPIQGKGLGNRSPLASLLRRGYLVKNGDGGYLRTDKEFVIG